MRFSIVAITLIALILVFGCAQPQTKPEVGPIASPAPAPAAKPVAPKPAAAEVIKIGWQGPLTGEVSNLGSPSKDAVEMAVDEVNEKWKGKMKLEVVFEDDQCDPKISSTVITKMINQDRVKVVLGGLCSGASLAAVPIADKAKVLMLSYCASSPKLTTASDYFFRVYPSDALQGVVAANYVFNEMGIKKAAILHENNDWAVGLRDTFTKRFTELGGTITTTEAYDPAAKDMRAQLTKVKATSPALVYMPAYPEGAALLLKQAKELGITVPLLNGDAGADTKIIENAGDAAEGAMHTQPFVSAPADFLAKYKAKKNRDGLSLCDAYAYDATHLIAKGVEEVGYDATKLKDWLYGVQNYQGVTGTIGFDKNGDPIKATYAVMQVKSGKFEKQKEIKAA